MNIITWLCQLLKKSSFEGGCTDPVITQIADFRGHKSPELHEQSFDGSHLIPAKDYSPQNSHEVPV
jgi:hypothetical protein